MVSQCDGAFTASGQGRAPKSICGVCVAVGELLPIVGVAVPWFEDAGDELVGLQALMVRVTLSTSEKSRHVPGKACLGCCSGVRFVISVSFLKLRSVQFLCICILEGCNRVVKKRTPLTGTVLHLSIELAPSIG